MHLFFLIKIMTNQHEKINGTAYTILTKGHGNIYLWPLSK